MGWFSAPPPDPKEQIREWKSSLRKEMRGLDRQVMRIEREEMKIKQSVRDAAKKGQTDVAKVLAKSLVESRRAKNRIHKTKAQINSVSMQIQQQASMARVAGAMGKSAEVMAMMQQLVRMPEIQETMRQMSMEMQKAGLIEEMMEDTMDSVLDDSDMEEEAEEEVEKVLMELTSGLLGANVSTRTPAVAAAAEEAETGQADDLSARLAALRS
ncbi:uncharacterized protein MONBRDRAFT_32664 [Monosiga brevicollis MX1]|uniref:Charged multivesicular body protein 3 n=1 Tax=Monosiga brevicollis TaxID=81824 RepID=A9V105_MONBE|nr:uncharacterized protein MONBRDRAFT_32664 [Monosiga brevicollis MX1]EDQ88724.1 predicted protein [Monosiga brevicollis MX1]|eukprot:XP_001746337.1 hypothetical protein [Monosiga brevicollis MX1]